MASSRPTSRDIAYLAGVSQATVSRALRNSDLVRPETRERIMEVARQLNYRVDRTAAGLRSRQSRTLALLLFEESSTDETQINPFFLAMLGSITRAATALDYDLLVSFQQQGDNWHSRYEASNTADGIILLGYGDYVTYGEKLEALAKADAHYIIWGPTREDVTGHSLGCDNVAGGVAGTRHLIECGRRRIAFIGNATRHFPEFEERYRGYEQALVAAGLHADPRLQITAESQEMSGYEAAQQLLEPGLPFDGIVAASDLIAIGVINALREAGRRIPDDVGVVGFDDIPAASYVTPRLTTLRQDTVLAGRKLVTNLVRVIEGERVESGLLTPQLVVRESSVCPA